jgi:Uma2 family endonuclease
MNIQAPERMSVDEFLVWAEGRPGRYELVEGVVHQMSPEKIRHVETKLAIVLALRAAIKRRGADCYALPDGVAVRISDRTAFEPDVSVYAGPRQDGDDRELKTPLIVVEVASPSTVSRDSSTKLRGYFSRPTIAHYLIVDATEQTVVHHARGVDGAISTRILSEGVLALDPPGIEMPVADLFRYE